jgi:histidyl-tRNA synthetase
MPSDTPPPSPNTNPASTASTAPIAPATGTRDLYPIELARRRWIEDKWRRTAIRHGFDEIDGPAFEPTELYTRKSGEGIVSEIFGVYSGKDEASVKQMGQRLADGERGAIAPYALRPEFTPTLARMFAARAGQLAKPTKWFWQQNCFRAERPQRGRLREFMQWNCDILGGESEDLPRLDAECIAVCIDLLASCGLKPDDVRVRVSDRRFTQSLLASIGIVDVAAGFAVLDAVQKVEESRSVAALVALGASDSDARRALATVRTPSGSAQAAWPELFAQSMNALKASALDHWVVFDPSIVRGLAYYTGMVFEVIVGGERAVAGGGRYDKLIETFGGPPTPAVGFGMGDVVLSLVLQDKGLMPSDKQIAQELHLRPDAFVISNGSPEADTLVAPLLARLRAGGKHARRSYKSTGKIGKLLKDASDQHARYAIIIESPTEITLKNLDDNTQDRGPTDELLKRITPPGPWKEPSPSKPQAPGA